MNTLKYDHKYDSVNFIISNNYLDIGSVSYKCFVVMEIYPDIQILVRYILYVTSVYLTTLDNCVGFIVLK